MLEMASTGRPKVSTVWNYFEYSEIEEKSMCKVLVKIQGEDTQEEECMQSKYPTNLSAAVKDIERINKRVRKILKEKAGRSQHHWMCRQLLRIALHAKRSMIMLLITIRSAGN